MNFKKPQKPVLVISSHVVRGSVGNRAAAFALEALGHPVWALPTVVLPWHPGHGAATRITALSEEFASLCEDLANAPWSGELAGVITGYMGNCEQVRAVGKLIGTLKKNNPELVYLCDPVLGDLQPQSDAQYGASGSLYVEENTAEAIRDILLPIADIVTPNLFELAWLSGKSTIQDQKELLSVARNFGVDEILITSVPALMRGNIGCVLVDNANAMMSEHRAMDNPPNGLGDLTAALFLSHNLHGAAPQSALEKTSASVFEILVNTKKTGADELALEANLISLSRPMAMVNMRKLG